MPGRARGQQAPEFQQAPDFYDTLGVTRSADAAEIQRAYRKLARQFHPDVNKDPSAEERFKAISEAYDVLSDPDTRRRYDDFGADFRSVPEGVDPRTWARARSYAGAGAGARSSGGGGAGGRTAGTGWGRSGGTNGSAAADPFSSSDFDVEDLFSDLFGGRGSRGSGWGDIPGADQEAEVEISLEEAYSGGRRSISLSGPDGSRTLDVTIPPGVTNGQRIRLAGQGGQGGSGAASGRAPAGDLYLIVRIADHPRYRVEGRDVFADLPLAPWEAALGASAPLLTPTGKTTVTVPAGTSSGRRLRLRGRGLPASRGAPGDLYAVARIVVPSEPTAEERRLFEQLAQSSAFDARTAKPRRP